MVNIIDVVIIAIALMAALGALLLLRPQVGQRSERDVHHLRELREAAEQEQQRIAQILNTIQHGAQDAEGLTSELKTHVEQIRQDSKKAVVRAEEAELVIGRAKEAEHELRSISTQLGERIQHVQDYWDEQLSDTVETVRNVHKKLSTGLTQVDDGLLRFREQEKMAQGFTQKLVAHQKEQFSAQQENARIAIQINAQLESLLQESTRSLQGMQEQQKRADELFSHFSTGMQGQEQQAHTYFASIFQATDSARQEMQASLEETRSHLSALRKHEEQGSTMNQRILQQFDQVEKLPVERLTRTVDMTDEMCSDLQAGLENARNLLKTLEAKTTQLVNGAEASPVAPEINDVANDVANNQEEDDQEKDGSKRKQPNLFSLRAYR